MARAMSVECFLDRSEAAASLDVGSPKFDLDQIHGCRLLIEWRVAPRLWSPDPPESASGPGLPRPPNPLSGATRGSVVQLPIGPA
jgi:hypothetical protein